MRDQTGDIAIEVFVGRKPKMHSCLVDNNEHKNAKGIKVLLKNVAGIIGTYEIKI